jgi:hypothetical protein
MVTKLHTSLVTLKDLMLKILAPIIKKQKPQLMQDLLYVCQSPQRENASRVGCRCMVNNANVS